MGCFIILLLWALLTYLRAVGYALFQAFHFASGRQVSLFPLDKGVVEQGAWGAVASRKMTECRIPLAVRPRIYVRNHLHSHPGLCGNK